MLIFQYTPQKPESRHEKPAPEYPSAAAGIGVSAYLDRGKRIGSVLNSVEKAKDNLRRRKGVNPRHHSLHRSPLHNRLLLTTRLQMVSIASNPIAHRTKKCPTT